MVCCGPRLHPRTGLALVALQQVLRRSPLHASSRKGPVDHSVLNVVGDGLTTTKSPFSFSSFLQYPKGTAQNPRGSSQQLQHLFARVEFKIVLTTPFVTPLMRFIHAVFIQGMSKIGSGF